MSSIADTDFVCEADDFCNDVALHMRDGCRISGNTLDPSKNHVGKVWDQESASRRSKEMRDTL